MTAEFTIDLIHKAKRMLDDNDREPSDFDGKLICYEWEAERLIAGGVKPDRLAIIPRRVPR